MEPQFWQQFLASDAAPERLWYLVDGARAAFLSGLPCEEWPGFSDAERRNMSNLANLAAPDTEIWLPDKSVGVPPALFCKGDVSCLQAPKLAVVGTRGASQYGKSVAALFCTAFADAGCSVVSGGAIGIDTSVHESVLESNGKTVVVLPCGVDVTYPSRNRALFDRVASSGCLVSQFPCGAGLREHWLPRRNMLVAGLCDALVVVEAPEKSGSLMTAQAAREAGKPVFVVPGPVSQTGFAGSHDLIRAGAALVYKPEHVLQELGIRHVERKRDNKGLGPDEAAVLSVVSGVPRNLESICADSGLKIDEVLTSITVLEIEGLVERSGDGYALKP